MKIATSPNTQVGKNYLDPHLAWSWALRKRDNSIAELSKPLGFQKKGTILIEENKGQGEPVVLVCLDVTIVFA